MNFKVFALLAIARLVLTQVLVPGVDSASNKINIDNCIQNEGDRECAYAWWYNTDPNYSLYQIDTWEYSHDFSCLQLHFKDSAGNLKQSPKIGLPKNAGEKPKKSYTIPPSTSIDKVTVWMDGSFIAKCMSFHLTNGSTPGMSCVDGTKHTPYNSAITTQLVGFKCNFHFNQVPGGSSSPEMDKSYGCIPYERGGPQPSPEPDLFDGFGDMKYVIDGSFHPYRWMLPQVNIVKDPNFTNSYQYNFNWTTTPAFLSFVSMPSGVPGSYLSVDTVYGSHAGTYFYSLTVTTQNSLPITISFKIIMDCLVTSEPSGWNSPSQDSILIGTNGQSNSPLQSTTAYSLTITPNCPNYLRYDLVLAPSNLPAPACIKVDPIAKKLSFASCTESDAGVHNLRLKVFYSVDLSLFRDYPSSTSSFTETIIAPTCDSVQIVSPTPLPDVYYDLSQTPPLILLSSYSFNTIPSPCDLTFTLSSSSGSYLQTPAQSSSTLSFSMNGSVPTTSSTFLYTLEYQSGAGNPKQLNFNFVVISECVVQSLNISTNQQLFTALISNDFQTLTFSNSPAPNCNPNNPTMPYEIVSVQKDDNFITSNLPTWAQSCNQASGIISFAANVPTNADVGSWVFEIHSVIAADPTKNQQQIVSNSVFISIVVTSPCQSAMLTLLPSDMSYQVGQAALTQLINVSCNEPSCGEIIMAILPSFSFIFFDSALKQITIETTDPQDTGTHFLEITAYLSMFPYVRASTTFTVQIDCFLTGLQLAPIPALTYSIAVSQPLSHQITYDLLTPACPVNLSLSAVPYTSAIYRSNNFVTISSSNPSDEGVYVMTLTATPENLSDQKSSVVNFVVTFVNMCRSQKIVDQAIPNVSVVLQSPKYSEIQYLAWAEFQLMNLPPELECGNLTQNLSLTSGEPVPDWIVFIPDSNQLSVNFNQVSQPQQLELMLVVQLGIYSEVKLTKYIKVTLDSLALKCSINPPVTYRIGSEPLPIEVLYTNSSSMQNTPGILVEPLLFDSGNNELALSQTSWISYQQVSESFAVSTVGDLDPGFFQLGLSLSYDGFPLTATKCMKTVIMQQASTPPANVTEVIPEVINKTQPVANFTSPKMTSYFKPPNTTTPDLPLRVQIQNITSSGVMTIKFTRPVMLNLDYYDEHMNIQIRKRRLGAQQEDPEQKRRLKILKNAFALEYIAKPAEYSTELVDYEVTEFKEAMQIQIQLNFTNPLMVSYDSVGSDLNSLDLLIVSFNDSQAFIDPVNNQPLNKTMLLNQLIYLPKQQPAEVPSFLAFAAQTAKAVAKAALPGVIVMNILLGLSLKKLWSAVNILQFLIYVHEWVISPPGNLDMLFTKISFFARGDWIPKDWIMERLHFASNPDDTQGKQTKFLILILAVMAAFTLILLLLLVLSKYCSASLMKILQAQKQAIFWNGVIRYVLQSYLDYSVSVLLVLAMYKQHKVSTIVSNFLLGVPLLLVVVFGCFYLLYRNRDRLDDPAIDGKVGTLYMGLHETRPYARVSYSVVFLARRFLYAAVSAFAGTYDGGLTLLLAVGISIVYQLYVVVVRPNKEQSANRIELAGEVFLLYSFFGTMMCELERNPIKRYRLGWYGVLCVAVLVLINVINLFSEASERAYWRVKIFLSQKQRLSWMERMRDHRLLRYSKQRHLFTVPKVTVNWKLSQLRQKNDVNRLDTIIEAEARQEVSRPSLVSEQSDHVDPVKIKSDYKMDKTITKLLKQERRERKSESKIIVSSDSESEEEQKKPAITNAKLFATPAQQKQNRNARIVDESESNSYDAESESQDEAPSRLLDRSSSTANPSMIHLSTSKLISPTQTKQQVAKPTRAKLIVVNPATSQRSADPVQPVPVAVKTRLVTQTPARQTMPVESAAQPSARQNIPRPEAQAAAQQTPPDDSNLMNMIYTRQGLAQAMQIVEQREAARGRSIQPRIVQHQEPPASNSALIAAERIQQLLDKYEVKPKSPRKPFLTYKQVWGPQAPQGHQPPAGLDFVPEIQWKADGPLELKESWHESRRHSTDSSIDANPANTREDLRNRNVDARWSCMKMQEVQEIDDPELRYSIMKRLQQNPAALNKKEKERFKSQEPVSSRQQAQTSQRQGMQQREQSQENQQPLHFEPFWLPLHLIKNPAERANAERYWRTKKQQQK